MQAYIFRSYLPSLNASASITFVGLSVSILKTKTEIKH